MASHESNAFPQMLHRTAGLIGLHRGLSGRREYRRRMKKKAMERYALKRMRRKFKVSAFFRKEGDPVPCEVDSKRASLLIRSIEGRSDPDFCKGNVQCSYSTAQFRGLLCPINVSPNLSGIDSFSVAERGICSLSLYPRLGRACKRTRARRPTGATSARGTRIRRSVSPPEGHSLPCKRVAESRCLTLIRAVIVGSHLFSLPSTWSCGLVLTTSIIPTPWQDKKDKKKKDDKGNKKDDKAKRDKADKDKKKKKDKKNK
jgi:hypothetical protein